MKKIFIICGLILVICVGLLWWVSIDIDSQISQPLNLSEPDILTIERGDSLQSVANEIVTKAWLPHPYYFIYEARRNGLSDKIQSGEYEIRPGNSARDLLDKIVTGKVVQYSMTLVEGWTFRQIMSAIEKNNILVKTFEQNDAGYVMQQLGLSGLHPEGRFFPDTYKFPSGTSDRQFLIRAFERMEMILNEEWQARDLGLPYESPFEALILASIIEKETAVPDERSAIAGVFVRRLKQNMKLQTDPTVIYAIGEAFDGDIRKKDLSIDSPYNTYMHRGLPPTPIAAPGRAAINAALHPEQGTSLYFVAIGDGRHYFSDTLDEHNDAVARYQLK